MLPKLDLCRVLDMKKKSSELIEMKKVVIPIACMIFVLILNTISVVSPPAGDFIWTSKSTYCFGEYVDIYFGCSYGCVGDAEVVLCTPSGCSTRYRGHLSGIDHTGGVAGPPAGERTAKLYMDGDLIDTTNYWVENCGGDDDESSCKQWLHVKCNVGGYKLYIDEKYMFTEDGDGNCGVELRPGTYEVKLKKDNCSTITKTARIRCGSDTTLRVTMNCQQEKGSIKVIVKDDSGKKLKDAKVYLDGSYQGKTNSSGEYTIRDAEPGSHTVKATKSGYEDDSEKVTVSADKTKTVYLTLEGEKNLWNDLKKEDSYYLRENSGYEKSVYFSNEIAQMYAPVFYIEEGAEPEPSYQGYRILKLDKGGYLIQYIQVYPIQYSITFHTIDYSVVYIYINKDHKIERIIFDGGTDLRHWDVEKTWEEIQNEYRHAIENKTHLKLIIKDAQHRMKLPNRSITGKVVEVRALRDKQLGYFYGYANIGLMNRYMNSMGWDITNADSVVASVKNNLPVTLSVRKDDSKLYIKVKAESESRVTIYLTEKESREKFTIHGAYYMEKYKGKEYKLDQGIPIISGTFEVEISLDYDIYEWIDFPEEFIEVSIEHLNGLRVWAVVHKVTANGIRRGQKYSSELSTSSSIHLRSVFSSRKQPRLTSLNSLSSFLYLLSKQYVYELSEIKKLQSTYYFIYDLYSVC